MPKIDDEHMALGMIYAEAMLTLAKEANQTNSLRSELDDLSSYLDRDEDFALFMSSPSIDDDVREAVIEKLFRGRYSDLLVNALQILNRKGRSWLVPAVAQAYRQALERERGFIEAEVASAVPLGDELREKIKEVVRSRTGRMALLKERVDPSLIGGIILRIGDEKLDGSVARQLKLLGERLLERASEEILSGRTILVTAT